MRAVLLNFARDLTTCQLCIAYVLSLWLERYFIVFWAQVANCLDHIDYSNNYDIWTCAGHVGGHQCKLSCSAFSFEANDFNQMIQAAGKAGQGRQATWLLVQHRLVVQYSLTRNRACDSLLQCYCYCKGLFVRWAFEIYNLKVMESNLSHIIHMYRPFLSGCSFDVITHLWLK